MWKLSDGDDHDDGRGCEQRPVLRWRQKERLVIDILAGILFPLSALAFPLHFSQNPPGKQTWRKRHHEMMERNTVICIVVIF